MSRLLIALLLALTLAATDAVACSCIRTTDALGAAAGTDAVFRARVVASMGVLTNADGAIISRGEHERPVGYEQRLVVLRVEELFKGAVAPLAVLVTGSGGGDCGYGFEEGKEYLVFADLSSEKRLTALAQSPQVLTTSICSFTQPAAEAKELLGALAKKYPAKQPMWVSQPE